MSGQIQLYYICMHVCFIYSELSEQAYVLPEI